MIGVEVKGTVILIRNLRGTNERILDAVEDGINEGANLVVNEMADRHDKYPIGAEVHDSARDENPDGTFRFLSRSGQLRTSMRAVEARRLATSIVAESVAGGGSLVDYAVHVEYGTSQMDAYPFARPAAESEAEAVGGAILKNVERAL